MKKFVPLFLFAALEAGCGDAKQLADNQSSSQQAPIKVALSPKTNQTGERIRITAVDNQVTIKEVTVNRGNCSIITGDEAVGLQYFLPAQIAFQQLIRESKIDSKEVMEASVDTEKTFRLLTKYVKDPVPPYPKFPQRLQFGDVYQLGYMCERVVEMVVATDNGSWTFTWE